MPIKLVIFDLDGTLADTLEDITSSLNTTLAAFGLPARQMKEVRKMVGGGVERLVEQAVGPQNLSMAGEVLARYTREYSEHIVDATRLYPGVREMLENLRGFKKAVISNKRTEPSTRILRGLGIEGHFDLVAGADIVPEKKPSPKPVLYVLEKLGASPGEAAIVGDSAFDAEAGRKACLKCVVGVTWGYGDKEELRDADYVIDRMDKLVAVLYGREPMMERRREERFALTEAEGQYFRLTVRTESGLIPASFVDLSMHGLRFESPRPFQETEKLSLIVSVPRSLTRKVELAVEVRQVAEREGKFLVGGLITAVSDELWFRVMKRVLDFIKEREGEMF
jgi:phosphoglycolate phosphatase